jgi:hypothetical protein
MDQWTKPLPLTVHYDPHRDVVRIDGMEFSGLLFRTWKTPCGRFFRFTNVDGVVSVEQVLPCLKCRKQFGLSEPMKTTPFERGD